MSDNNTSNNKRLAKNTVVLYFRTLIVMIVHLYTSRVILATLGVEDYGVYNVVGGAVMMFSVVSGSIANAISRFITFELGKNNIERLKDVFCNSINIQIGIVVIVLVIGETLGLWFLNTYMNIPEKRMFEANIVYQCSLLSFIINLLSIPYNASIIAHERMTAFAYIGIVEVLLKLFVVIILPYFLTDKLVTYAILLVVVALIIRVTYVIYCKRNFIECHYKFSINKKLLGDMAGFSGWQFLTNTCWIVNTQGLNILSNIYFGVAINAARGIAHQVEGAIMQFVNNFTTAINPQIIKSYAQNEKEQFFLLIVRGAKFSYFLMLIIALPVLIETDFLLSLWLKDVPNMAVTFTRLSIFAALSNMLGSTGVTACMATGNIKKYAIIISAVGYLVVPITWMLFSLGYPAEMAYYVFISIYIVIIFVRLYVMKGLLGFPPMMYIKYVLIPIVIVSLLIVPVPLFLHFYITTGNIQRLIMVTVVSIVFSIIVIYCLGLDKSERNIVKSFLEKKIKLH